MLVEGGLILECWNAGKISPENSRKFVTEKGKVGAMEYQIARMHGLDITLRVSITSHNNGIRIPFSDVAI